MRAGPIPPSGRIARLASRLNTWPSNSPVNASSQTSRPDTHDSGPIWLALPFIVGDSHPLLLPVSRRTRVASLVLISMTQEFQDDPTGNLIRQVLGSFDEYQRRENAKHKLRAMQENARQ